MQITLEMIYARSTPNSFSKGEHYYQSGALINTAKHGNTLEGFCQGSNVIPYHVQVKLSDTTIESAICTCPYSFEGDCKHIIALLLAYLNMPEDFAEHLSIEQALQNRSKDDLVTLILNMIDKYPDLRLMVQRPVPSNQQKDVDLSSFRRELDYAFQHYDGWGDRTAESAVWSIGNTAADFAKKGDHHNASRIYRTIIERALELNDYPYEDDGEFALAFNAIISNLAKCLDHHPFAENATERQAILIALLESYIWDTNQGGYGIAEEAPELLMKYIRVEDVEQVRKRIQIAIEEPGAYAALNLNRRNRVYARLLMELDVLDNTDIDVTLNRLREQNQHQLLFGKLLDLKRVDEAIKIAEELLLAPHDRLSAAQKLAYIGQTNVAIRLVEAGLAEKYDARLIAWLIETYKSTGKRQARLDLELRKMLTTPTVRNYESLNEVAQELDVWQSTKQTVLDELEKRGQLSELTRLHLHESNWDAAWETLQRKQAQQPKPTSRFPRFSGPDRLEFEVARAAKNDQPEKAIPVYIKAARQQINNRKRSCYEEAAKLLTTVRDLYQQLDDQAGWEQTISEIKTEFKKLRALQDELKKANL